MIIRSISLINFMNISKATLNFKSGINALWGINGSGKSAVLEAISFMLLDHKRGDSWRDFIKNGEKSFKIGMELQMSSEDASLMQFLFTGAKSSGSVEKSITYKNKTYNGTDANTFLKNTFDQEMIENIVFSLQDGKTITNITPSERRDIFKKIFNSDFSEILEKVEKDQKSLMVEESLKKAEFDILSQKKYHFFRIVEVNQSELDNLNKELEASQASELDKQKYKFYTEKVKELNIRQSEMTSLGKRKEEHQKSIDELSKRIELLETNIFNLKKFDSEADEEIKINNEKVSSLKEELKKYQSSFSVKDTEKEIEIMTIGRTGLMAQIKLLTMHKEAHAKGECQTCGQKCDTNKIPEIQSAIDLNTQLLNDHIADVKKMVSKIDEYKKKLSEYEIALRAEEKTLNNAIFTKQKSLITLKGEEDKIATIRDEQIPKEKKYVIDADKSISELELKITSLVSWCHENKVDLVTEDAQKRSIDQIQKEIKSFMEGIQANIQQEKINQTLLKEKKEDQEHLDTLTQEINTIQLQIKDLDIVKKIVTTDFPAWINTKACVILQNFMNSFFASTKDKFQITLTNDKKGVIFSYKAGNEPEWNNAKMVSGFETALLTLGFKVGVAKAYNSDLIILDEPDKTADNKSSEKLFQTISNIGGFKQIFVITHKDSAMEYMKENGALIYKVSNGEFSILE